MIRIVEVGPRDGLQNISSQVPTEIKVAFINALSNTGLDEIEITSFVSPKWVPQLADAEAVCSEIDRNPSVTYMALVPNERGLERAIAGKVDKIAVFTAASETFSQRNVSASIAESIERFKPVIAASPVPVRGYVSTAFYCPYEGKIEPSRVADVIAQLLDVGCTEISIGDTIGKAVPDEIRVLLTKTLQVCGIEQTAMHFHDTFGNAIENVRASYGMGIQTFDSSTNGLGGCPFAPGAKGNIATEALLAEFQTAVDFSKILAAGTVIAPFVN